MTRSPRKLRYVAWLILWIYAAMGLQPFEALVLCIDAQGHIALEPATADGVCFDCPPIEPADAGGCCSEPEPERRDLETAPRDLESEPREEWVPCDCDDVVLLAGAPDGAIATRSVTFQHPARLAPPLPLQASLAPELFRSARGRDFAQRPPGARSAARSLVLRI